MWRPRPSSTWSSTSTTSTSRHNRGPSNRDRTRSRSPIDRGGSRGQGHDGGGQRRNGGGRRNDGRDGRHWRGGRGGGGGGRPLPRCRSPPKPPLDHRPPSPPSMPSGLASSWGAVVDDGGNNNRSRSASSRRSSSPPAPPRRPPSPSPPRSAGGAPDRDSVYETVRNIVSFMGRDKNGQRNRLPRRISPRPSPPPKETSNVEESSSSSSASGSGSGSSDSSSSSGEEGSSNTSSSSSTPEPSPKQKQQERRKRSRSPEQDDFNDSWRSPPDQRRRQHDQHQDHTPRGGQQHRQRKEFFTYQKFDKLDCKGRYSSRRENFHPRDRDRDRRQQQPSSHWQPSEERRGRSGGDKDWRGNQSPERRRHWYGNSKETLRHRSSDDHGIDRRWSGGGGGRDGHRDFSRETPPRQRRASHRPSADRNNNSESFHVVDTRCSREDGRGGGRPHRGRGGGGDDGRWEDEGKADRKRRERSKSGGDDKDQKAKKKVKKDSSSGCDKIDPPAQASGSSQDEKDGRRRSPRRRSPRRRSRSKPSPGKEKKEQGNSPVKEVVASLIEDMLFHVIKEPEKVVEEAPAAAAAKMDNKIDVIINGSTLAPVPSDASKKRRVVRRTEEAAAAEDGCCLVVDASHDEEGLLGLTSEEEGPSPKKEEMPEFVRTLIGHGVPTSVLLLEDGFNKMCRTFHSRLVRVLSLSQGEADRVAKGMVRAWQHCGENYYTLKERYASAARSSSSFGGGDSPSDGTPPMMELREGLHRILRKFEKRRRAYRFSELVDLTMYYFNHVDGRHFDPFK